MFRILTQSFDYVRRAGIGLAEEGHRGGEILKTKCHHDIPPLRHGGIFQIIQGAVRKRGVTYYPEIVPASLGAHYLALELAPGQVRGYPVQLISLLG